MAGNEHELILAELKQIKANLNNISMIISGNGKPSDGLVVQFVQLRDSVKACQQIRCQEKTDTKNNNRALTVAAISAVVAMVCTVVNLLF